MHLAKENFEIENFPEKVHVKSLLDFLGVLRGGGRGGESILDNFNLNLSKYTIAHLMSAKH